MSEEKQTKTAPHGKPKLHVALLFFCFVAGFLGAAVFLQTGLIKPRETQVITKNQEKIVAAEGDVIASVAKKVSPSVVSVTTKSVSTTLGSRGVVSEGAGTGIIISSNGYILTNKHVIKDAQNITVVASNGMVYKDVSLVGSDPLNDFAFLKIKADGTRFTPAHIGDSSQVEVGQKVVAIGNALGEYQNSVTNGIISGRGRPVTASDGESSDEQLTNLFQTDAAINPGNSGGPLLNFSGDVIGINTAVAPDAQGIGFAIPINAVKGLVKSVVASGAIKRAYLGVHYLNLDRQIAEDVKISTTQGAYVYDDTTKNAIVSGSPADKAGLLNGDIITAVNNQTIDENNGLTLLLGPYVPGDNITLKVLRNGATKTIDVTLGQYAGS